MDHKLFLDACEFINTNLINFKVSHTFNSIGSHVFFDFGEGKEVLFKNKKKFTEYEWTIWFGNVLWRLSRYGKYLVSSGDSPEVMDSTIQRLLGKHFQSLQFLSQFLDIEVNFEDGYQLTTFFNRSLEDQWTIFLSDKTTIGVDGSTPEAIKNLQKIAQHLTIAEVYKKIDFPKQEIVVTQITDKEEDLLIIRFENDTSIHLRSCAWRLEKDHNYLVGYLDITENDIDEHMFELIGKKLQRIFVNSMMDAKFQFEDGYILKTFVCAPRVHQWKICSNSLSIFHGDIQMENSQ